MERTSQQITNSAGERLLRECLEPQGWVVRKIEQGDDYGVDFEIEVFSDEDGQYHSTGFTFKVQLKSSMASRYISSKHAISQQIKKKHISYYCAEMSHVLILIVADVTNRRLFWLAPQLDRRIAALGNARSNQKVSVHVPTANELPASLEKMLENIRRAASAVATKTIVATPVHEFLQSIQDSIDDEKISKNLRDKSDAIRLSRLQSLFLSDRLDEATGIIIKVLKDEDSSIENKFWALLEEERIALKRLFQSEAPQSELPNISVDTSSKLHELTKDGPAALKFAAFIIRIGAELDVLSQRAYGLFLNYTIHKSRSSHMWSEYALLERINCERLLWRKYRQGLRMARYASSSPHRSATPAALLRIVRAIPVYLIVLDADGKDEEALQYRRSAFQLIQLAAWISRRVGEDETIKIAATLAIQISAQSYMEPSAWADKAVAEIQNAESRRDAEAMLARVRNRKAGIPQQGDKPATEQQIFENMAASLGIPLADPGHPLTKMFREGLAASSPTEALKHCVHSFVSIARPTFHEVMMGEQLGLPIGPKQFECVKHGHLFSSRSFSEAYQHFSAKYCSQCPDKISHPPEWVHSQEWHSQQFELVQESRTKAQQEKLKTFNRLRVSRITNPNDK